jgi:succinoglycan biosynthesis transport protein ExoP
MNLQQFLLALRARCSSFFVALAAVMIAAIVASLLIPKSFRATVSLLVDTKDEQSLSDSLRPLILPQERLSYLETQVDILKSRKVARQVVEDLRLADDPHALKTLGVEPSRQVPAAAQLVEVLLHGLKADTSQSSVVHASFSSPDPYLSAAIANGFAKAYVSTVLELRVAPTREAAAWFDTQLKQLRTNLEDAQSKLTDYQRKNGVLSTDERYDVEYTRLGQLSDQLAHAEEQTQQRRSSQQEAGRYLAGGGSMDRLPDVADNAFVQQLKTELLHGEGKLHELSTRYGVNHPDYQRQAADNASLRARLNEEMRRVVDGLGTSARQSQQRDANLQDVLNQQRSRVLTMMAKRNELTVLKRNVESAERAYDTAMQRYVVSQVDSRASQANVAVLNPAVVPMSADRPKLGLNLALALVSGVLLGGALVALLETNDRRVRSPEDLLLATQLPLLAVLGGSRRAGLLAGPSASAVRALPKLT